MIMIHDHYHELIINTIITIRVSNNLSKDLCALFVNFLEGGPENVLFFVLFFLFFLGSATAETK